MPPLKANISLILLVCIVDERIDQGQKGTISTIACALELVPTELNHLAAILHVYAGGLNFMK